LVRNRLATMVPTGDGGMKTAPGASMRSGAKVGTTAAAGGGGGVVVAVRGPERVEGNWSSPIDAVDCLSTMKP
jgi:hypothetical protein